MGSHPPGIERLDPVDHVRVDRAAVGRGDSTSDPTVDDVLCAAAELAPAIEHAVPDEMQDVVDRAHW